MKSVSLFSAVFVLCISCVCWSCSSDDLVVESQNSNNEVVMQNDSVKMAELILFINETAPQYSSYVNTANSRSLRSFFRWLRDVLKCDALGYLWGLGRGFGFQGSLIPGVACSVVGAVSLQSANGISQNDWKISSDWAVYSSPTYDYQKIGYDHNKSIYSSFASSPMPSFSLRINL